MSFFFFNVRSNLVFSLSQKLSLSVFKQQLLLFLKNDVLLCSMQFHMIGKSCIILEPLDASILFITKLYSDICCPDRI